MTEFRMGLKHVILQRLQANETISTISSQNDGDIKKHTDFSIRRILSDHHGSQSPRNMVNQQMAGDSEDILDLSKTTKSMNFFKEFLNRNHLNEMNNTRKSEFQAGNTGYQKVPSNGTDQVIKPKVLKFWEHCALNNNCNGCEMFFRNLNHNICVPNVKDDSSSAPSWPNASLPRKPEVVQKFVMKSMTVTLNRQMDDDVSYKCAFCEKVFGCAATLQSHEKTHKSPRYECLDCGKGFSQLRNYKYHLSVHRGTKEFAAECPECGKVFNDKGYLSSHMKIHRNKKEYECPYCPKSFNQRVAFNMHVRIHTGVKPHKCTDCGKRFSRKMLLKQHMRTHSGEKPYQCSVCGKSFADRSNMTLHHRLHSGIKPFSCPICPKAFTKKHHLKTHLNYHTGCKPYVCPHPNCNQAFTQSSNMRTHSKKCQFRPAETIPTNAVVK